MAVEPIADLQWGVGDWKDYEHNWREKDVEYLQDRVVSRYLLTDDIDDIALPSVGRIVYNNETDRLMMRSKSSAWVRYDPLPLNMKVTQDTPTVVGLAHLGASTGGIQFLPSGETKINGTLNVLNDAVRITAGGILIGPEPIKATISYDGTSVIGDKPFRIPALILTGAGPVVVDAGDKEIKAGTFRASSLVHTPSITLTGTLTGGVINGSSGTIGGVKLGVTASQAEAPAGFLSRGAKLVGDDSKAILSHSTLAGRVEVAAKINLVGDGVDLRADMAVRNKALAWYNASDALKGYYAITVYDVNDPGAINFPDGTIWFA